MSALDRAGFKIVATGMRECLTGAIGFFVVVACAATLHRSGRSIQDAADAAVALEPLAGGAASTLFAVGLIGAAFFGRLHTAAVYGLLGV